MRGSRVFVMLALTVATGVQPAAQSASGAQGATSGATSAQVRPATPAILPGTPATAFATIHVRAVSATNTALRGWLVRLRDVRFGRVIASHLTDEAGTFAFRDVDPGSYVIELLGANQSIQGTSALLNVDAGAVEFAVIRLPTRPGALAAFFDQGVAQAAIITAAAAAAGVLAVQSTTDVSPR